MKALWLFITLITLQPARSQDDLIATITVTGIRQLTVDRAGDLYVVTEKSVVKIDSVGNRLAVYDAPSAITSFDPGNGVRQMVYRRKTQEVTVLTPTFTEKMAFTIDESLAIEPWLTCSSGDYDVLILDAADGTVKKVDTRKMEVVSDFALSFPQNREARDISFMREYQRYIFLLDETGIVMYNMFGHVVKQFEATTQAFHFLGQELYYLENDRMVYFDLFSGARRETPLDREAAMVVVTDTRRAMAGQDTVSVYRHTPSK